MTQEQLLRAYRDMLLIRRFEEKAGQLYGMGLIGGFCHLYIGQEAVVVGMQACLEPGDQVITSYRDHGHMLATGMEARGVMAELTGRSGGYSKGKGGSMHMFSREKGFYGGHGIVGAQVSLGTGLAFANWYRESRNVALTYFGEGASNQGQVYESFNLAALMKLPVHLHHREQQVRHGHQRGARLRLARPVQERRALGHPGRAGGRHGRGGGEGGGHARRRPLPRRQRPVPAGDEDLPLPRPLHVRPGEVPHAGRGAEDARAVRPHREGRKALLEGGTGEAELKTIDDEMKAIVQDAADFAQSSPEPDENELWTDVLLEEGAR